MLSEVIIHAFHTVEPLSDLLLFPKTAVHKFFSQLME